MRLRSQDSRRGKRGGYRAVYYIHTPEHIIMLVIYAKTRQEEVSPDLIRRVIEEELGGE